MTRTDGVAPETRDDVSPADWGTWEELLLAFAVNRHGTGAWDSIALEVQKRTSDPTLSLTAHSCRLKYIDLKRRFVAPDGDLEDDDGRVDKSNVKESVPLLEELRKFRVAELRREVERYDLNIESLELKMKKMEEERQRSSRGENSQTDLEKKGEVKRDVEPETDPATGCASAAGGELEKDRFSVNESNSTDPGAEKLRTGDKESEPARGVGAEIGQDQTGQRREEPDEGKSEPDRKSVREDSCNGSSNSIDEPERKAIAGRATNSAELIESEAESDGGRAEATKENSDMQSSASRSLKEEGSDKVWRGRTSGDERDHEDQSRAVKELCAESQPLVEFLQAIRARKLGSLFERRLRSQETTKYQKLILQHVDLETVDTRLKEGCYSGPPAKFFRDLLLLVNNAFVFFSKNSAEADAAAEIRYLISKELYHKNAKSDSSSAKQISLQSQTKLETKEEQEPSLMLKPRIAGSLIVCRKRSSIAAKASASSSGTDKKKEQSSLLAEEDTKMQRSQISDDAEEQKVTKKRTRDRFPVANTKKNGKNQNNNNGSKNSVEPGKQRGKGGSCSQHSEPKNDNKKSQPASDSKKRGATNFLNRMKQGSSSNNGDLLDALKNTPLTSETNAGKGGSDVKKNDSAKRGQKKEPAGKRSTETRQAKEKGSPVKRNVGRPPKRGAAAAAAAPPALGKRGRERGETETPPPKQTKKRSRKL